MLRAAGGAGRGHLATGSQAHLPVIHEVPKDTVAVKKKRGTTKKTSRPSARGVRTAIVVVCAGRNGYIPPMVASLSLTRTAAGFRDLPGLRCRQMPVYEYICSACGHAFEKLVRSSSARPRCEKCGSRKPARQFSTFAAHGGAASGTRCEAAEMCTAAAISDGASCESGRCPCTR